MISHQCRVHLNQEKRVLRATRLGRVKMRRVRFSRRISFVISLVCQVGNFKIAREVIGLNVKSRQTVMHNLTFRGQISLRSNIIYCCKMILRRLMKLLRKIMSRCKIF